MKLGIHTELNLCDLKLFPLKGPFGDLHQALWLHRVGLDAIRVYKRQHSATVIMNHLVYSGDLKIICPGK